MVIVKKAHFWIKSTIFNINRFSFNTCWQSYYSIFQQQLSVPERLTLATMALPPKMSCTCLLKCHLGFILQLISIYFIKELIGCIEMTALNYVIQLQTISSICRFNYNKIGRPPPKMSCSCLLKCHLCSVTTYTSLICLQIIRVHCVNCTKT